MIYALLVFAYIMVGTFIAAFGSSFLRDGSTLQTSKAVVFLWPLLFPIVAGIYLAKKMRGI